MVLLVVHLRELAFSEDDEKSSSGDDAARLCRADPGERKDRYGCIWAYVRDDQPFGGLPGFYDMLDAMTDPEHPHHEGAMEWAEDYDAENTDLTPIKFALSRIANSRNAAKSRLAKKSIPKAE